jgi:hypothetical protein
VEVPGGEEVDSSCCGDISLKDAAVSQVAQARSRLA